MNWFPIALAVIALVAGMRYLLRIRTARASAPPPRVDDDAIRQILQRGTLRSRDSLDMDEISRAEEEFWAESWDEPEEHRG